MIGSKDVTNIIYDRARDVLYVTSGTPNSQTMLSIPKM